MAHLLLSSAPPPLLEGMFPVLLNMPLEGGVILFIWNLENSRSPVDLSGRYLSAAADAGVLGVLVLDLGVRGVDGLQLCRGVATKESRTVESSDETELVFMLIFLILWEEGGGEYFGSWILNIPPITAL